MSVNLASEDVVVEAPFSFVGSTKRIHRLFAKAYAGMDNVGDYALAVLFACLETLVLFMAWSLVATWYLVWGIWLVPYRLIRRGQRKDKVAALRHREVIGASDK